MVILITSVRPIISITDIVHNIPSKILNVPPICSNTDTIFLSAIGSLNADVRWNAMDSTPSFITGIIHIASTTNIPTNPTAFFSILPHPSTASTDSPKAFPNYRYSTSYNSFSSFYCKSGLLSL